MLTLVLAPKVLLEVVLAVMVPPWMLTSAAPVNALEVARISVPPLEPVFSVPKKLLLELPKMSVPVWLAFKTPADVADMLGLKEKVPAPAKVKAFPPIAKLFIPLREAAALLFIQVWLAPIVTFNLFTVSKVTLPALAAIVMPPAPMVIVCDAVVVDWRSVVPVLLKVIPAMEALPLN